MYLLRSQIVRTVNMSCTHGRNQPAWSDWVHSVGLGERVQIAVIYLFNIQNSEHTALALCRYLFDEDQKKLATKSHL